MAAPQKPRADATWNFNHLRRGVTYRATTRDGIAVGEYLGMEAPYGDWAILLRRGTGTRSIALGDVTSIQPVAA